MSLKLKSISSMPAAEKISTTGVVRWLTSSSTRRSSRRPARSMDLSFSRVLPPSPRTDRLVLRF